MYHRNKVHTDEFWKYELAKHRRTVLDSKTNEDMWKKQLGKHAAEEEAEAAAAAAAQAGHRSRSLEVHDRKNLEQSERWLEQIKRSTSSDPNQNSQVSAEMKLLALQSLQNSLQMISMKLPPPPAPVAPVAVPKEERPVTPALSAVASAETAAPTQNQGYLTLLAHLSAQRKAEENTPVKTPVTPAPPALPVGAPVMPAGPRVLRQTSDSAVPPYLSEMKEESAVKRTQLWLAQLGQYRQKSFQDEIDRNHEELWEEQISKAVKNPVKSPLEPIEITIEDQNVTAEEEIHGNCKAALESPKRPPTPLSPLKSDKTGFSVEKTGFSVTPNNNVISIKTSAIQRLENSRTFSLSLEVNNNGTDYRHIPVPILPARKPVLTNVGTPVPVKKPLLEIPEDELPPPPVAPPVAEFENTSKTEVIEEESSVLKSLLKGRLPRKRPISPVPAVKIEAKRPSLSLDTSDILRRRLLGLNTEPSVEHPMAAAAGQLTGQPAVPAFLPKFQPPSATITSQQLTQQSQNNGDYEDQSSPVDLRNLQKPEQESKATVAPPMNNLPERPEAEKNYTQTSVLKHLLYRYTTDSNNSSS